MCYTLQFYLIIIDGLFLGLGAFYVMTGCVTDECIYYTHSPAKLDSVINGTYARFILEDHTTCYTPIGTGNIHINQTYDNVFIDKYSGGCFYDKKYILLIKFIVGVILLTLGYLFSALTIYVWCFERTDKVENSFDDVTVDTVSDSTVIIETV